MVSKHGVRNEIEQRDLERLRYWRGQKLRSRDFNDLAQIEEHFRWWHNRSLHEIPGVLEGLTVRLDGIAVVISPGLAYDGFGRELIHARESMFPLPNPLPEQDLVLLAYLPSYGQRGPSASSACLPSTPRPAGRQLAFVWLQVGESHRAQIGVPLGRLLRGPEGLVFDLERRFTRPFARPRIASGSTIPGATDWELWEVGDVVFGLQVRIDTSAAGFTRDPCYFAWLQGVDLLGIRGRETGMFDILTALAVEHIDEVSFHGFTFRLSSLLIRAMGKPKGGPFSLLQQIKPYVCWIGIESGLANTAVRREMNDGSI